LRSPPGEPRSGGRAARSLDTSRVPEERSGGRAEATSPSSTESPPPGKGAAGRRTGQASLLSVRHLDVGYGEVQVLWDVSLEIFGGEIVALVGANGAGKTTLLATISGLLKPWVGM